MASRYPGCREGGGPAMSVGGVVYTVLSDYGLQDPEGPRAPGRSSSTSDACRSLRVSFDGRAGEATQFPRTIPALGVAAVLVACLLILERRGQLGSLPVASSGQGRGHPVTGEVALESVYEAGKVQMLQIGSCRTKGLAPINERGGCLAAAKALHVLLNDTNLRTTDLADVPEGCYYCHNFVDGTYTLWLGTGAGSRGKGAETSQPTKTRQPICTEQAGKFSTSSPSAASTKSGKPDCDQGFSDWRTGWSGAKKAWCCKAHRRGCETTQTTMAIPTTSPRSSIPVRVASIKVGGPAEWWEVIARGGLVVRSGECSSCRAIGTKARYDVVRARRHGDWLQLASELGFVLLRRNGQTFLRRAKPYHMIRIVNGKCSTLGREPIRNQDDCNKAAKALGLAITSASVTTDKPRPEGCYYFEHHGEESLWLSTDPDNVGHGASIKPGSQRMPLCGLPGAASASPAPAPAAPTPAPASTTVAPTLAHPALSEKEKAWEESKREAEESKRKAHPALSEKEKAWEESKREAEESKREAASRTTSSAATAVDLGGVTIFMTVQNVEFNRLIDTPNLASVIVSAIKRAVLFMVDDPSVNEDHIQVTLSSGSVKVAATVRPPASVDAGSLRSKLSTRAPYACKALAADLTGVRAIYAVSTGKVTVGDIKVLGAPGLSTVSVTTTTMSTTTTQMTTSTRTTMTSTGTSTSTSSRTSSSTTTTRTTTTSSATSTTSTTNTATSTSTTTSTSSSTTTTTTSTHSTTTSTSTERTTVAPTTTTQEGATTTLATTSTTAHLLPARVTAAPTTTTTTTRVHWDCGGKDTEVRLWTLEQQGWCCTHHNRGCFDCHAGRSHWEVGWAPKKRDWCCKAYGVGCDYDCSQGQPWSQQRKVWCCLHKNIGCSDRASTVTVLQANPTPAPVAREGVPASGQGGSQGNVDVNWNCYDGEEVHWRSEKQDWCCLHRNKGCVEKPFDCRAELETWQVSWSQRKVDWCCRFEQMGCPLYDCGVGLANAEAAWSDGKKAWCCRTQRLGCPKPYNCHDGMENYFVHWSEEKRRWCCTNEQLGCVQPYNCQASADLWESGWSSRKKAWCCEHMKVCPRLWDCHGGADNWEVEWGKAQQAWCCRHHAIGCGYKCALPSTTWSFRERQWCCQYRGIECAGSSSAQFRAV